MLSNQEGNKQGFVSVPPIMNTYFMFDDMANSYLYLVAGLQLMSKSLNPLDNILGVGISENKSTIAFFRISLGNVV